MGPVDFLLSIVYNLYLLQVQVVFMMTSLATGLSIGHLAKTAGCNVETIRYYERIHLMPLPLRSTGNQRVYSINQLKRLHFICHCRRLGFTLDEVRDLLTFVEQGNYTCAQIKNITIKHLQHIREKIKHLQALEKILVNMTLQCNGETTSQCPIVDSLYATSTDNE